MKSAARDMAILDGHGRKPVSDRRLPSGTGQPLRCPWCLAGVDPVHPNQIFCSAAHRVAFHNLWTVRGAQLAPIACAARVTRDGSSRDKVTGTKTRQMSRQLMDRFNADDRTAGRMAMDEYMRLRLARGFDLP